MAKGMAILAFLTALMVFLQQSGLIDLRRGNKQPKVKPKRKPKEYEHDYQEDDE